MVIESRCWERPVGNLLPDFRSFLLLLAEDSSFGAASLPSGNGPPNGRRPGAQQETMMTAADLNQVATYTATVDHIRRDFSQRELAIGPRPADGPP
jgi:hypothetical protein